MAGKRTPRYPTVPLDEAVNKVSKIFELENTNPMTADVAVMHLGYTSYNGASGSVLSSLRKYGLLSGRGDSICVADDARVIIADAHLEDQSDRQEALMRCLLSNSVFKDLYERFQGSSSEINVQAHLMKNGFKPDAASAAAASYKKSVAFALDAKSDDEDIAISEESSSEALPREGVDGPVEFYGKAPDSRALKRDFEMMTGAFQSSQGKPTMKQDTYTLDNGELILAWPTGMSIDEVEDFEMWMDMMKKKVRRAVERQSAAKEGGSEI